jgi:hypothetical protein
VLREVRQREEPTHVEELVQDQLDVTLVDKGIGHAGIVAR